MILHYLGLDHIGHVFGPYSKLIPEKLKEMDGIIQTVYENTKKWHKKTAILITGDHGMKDSGGHGGSSFAETHVPFIILNEKCTGGFIEQVDIAPTLSLLLGIDIPSDNVGKLPESFVNTLQVDFRNYFLLYNSLILHCNEFQEILNSAKQFHYNFLKNANIADGLKASQLYYEYLTKSSEVLIHTSIEQDMKLLVVCLLFVIFCFFKILNHQKQFVDLLLIFSLLCSSFFYFDFSILLILVLIAYLLLQFICKNYKNMNSNVIFVVFSLIHVFSFTSSSFIEEEHYVWYFFLTTFFVYKSFLNSDSFFSFCNFFVAAVFFRFLRSLNQTGDKWALLPDTAHWFLEEENYFYLQLFYGLSLLLVFVCCFLQTKSVIINSLNVIILINIYFYKNFYSKNVLFGRLIWIIIVLNTIIGFYKGNTFINSWLLITSLLLREYNVILVPACIFLSKIINKKQKNPFSKTVLHYWLGNALYFCQGHSNSLASVDIAVGYIGLESYVPLFVIIQVLCHTYAMPVLAHLLLLENCKKHKEKCWFVLITLRMLCLIFVSLITLIHRNHLFIWSVFAPKLLIESCHSAIIFLELFVFFIAIKLFKNYLNCIYFI